MKKQNIHPLLKVIVACLATLAILLTLLVSLSFIFKKLDTFKIKEVVLNEPAAVDLSYLKGQNIFSIDLKKQARSLSEAYPIYKTVHFVRVLPHRIYVDLVKRKPLAYVRLYKYFSVDADGVFFDLAAVPGVLGGPSGTQASGLPVITGLETKIFGPRPGKRYGVKELTSSLEAIKAVGANPTLSVWRIKKIDASAPASLSLFIIPPLKNQARLAAPSLNTPDLGLEAKISLDDVREKTSVLANLLSQLKNDWLQIRYIDLRFKEPVVKFREKDVKR